jgi:hypothetical protein
MRKLLVISFVALAAGAVGCSRNQCGGTSMWSPCSLFGGGQQGYQSYQQPYQSMGGGCCCDPCGGGGAAMAPSGMMSQGMMSPAMMSSPVMTQAPCCGQ